MGARVHPQLNRRAYVRCTTNGRGRYLRDIIGRRHCTKGGHAVVAEIFFPHLVTEVQLTPLNDLLQEIVRETSTEFVNGRVVYEFLPVDENDEDVRDKLLKRIVMILAGIEFQSMEGLEAADLEVTEDAEALLIGKTFREFEKFNVLPEYQLPILDRADGLISDLRGDDGVRKAVTEVADKLVVSSPISGSCVWQIVEGVCCSELLERMRAPL